MNASFLPSNSSQASKGSRQLTNHSSTGSYQGVGSGTLTEEKGGLSLAPLCLFCQASWLDPSLSSFHPDHFTPILPLGTPDMYIPSTSYHTSPGEDLGGGSAPLGASSDLLHPGKVIQPGRSYPGHIWEPVRLPDADSWAAFHTYWIRVFPGGALQFIFNQLLAGFWRSGRVGCEISMTSPALALEWPTLTLTVWAAAECPGPALFSCSLGQPH